MEGEAWKQSVPRIGSSGAKSPRPQSWTEFGEFKGQRGWSSGSRVGRGQICGCQTPRVHLAMPRDISDSQAWGRRYWHLVAAGLGCCSTSENAQDGPGPDHARKCRLRKELGFYSGCRREPGKGSDEMRFVYQ